LINVNTDGLSLDKEVAAFCTDDIFALNSHRRVFAARNKTVDPRTPPRERDMRLLFVS
jgi:hypothetical protein